MAQSHGGAGASPPDADPPGQPTRRAAPPGQGLPAGRGEETAAASPGSYPATRSLSGGPVASPHPPTEAASPHTTTVTGGFHPRTADAAPGGGAGPGFERTASADGPPPDVRYGPGVPVSSSPRSAGPTAEEVWHTGQPSAPPPRSRRRTRRAASGALTVILLAAAGVVLFQRFHHSPLRVTGVAVTGQVTRGCSVDVTGRIATNGAAGTVSYQWLFQPQAQAPQPLSQSVVAGQGAVYVTVAVQGQGAGSAAQQITLQVLGPGTGTATTRVALNC